LLLGAAGSAVLAFPSSVQPQQNQTAASSRPKRQTARSLITPMLFGVYDLLRLSHNSLSQYTANPHQFNPSHALTLHAVTLHAVMLHAPPPPAALDPLRSPGV